MDVLPIIGMLSSSATVVLIVYFVTRARQRRVEAQVQMQSRLIDRFGSAPELVQFLHSPAGRSFVVGVESAPVALTRDRLVSGFTRAIVLTMLGAGFLFLTFYTDEGWAIPATIVFSLGLGYLVATFVSYKLAAKLTSETASEP
jgi:hypothetical protein